MSMMKSSSLFLLGALLSAPTIAASAQTTSEERDIRAGRTIAITTCIACHVVSRDQSLKPVLGPGIPSFEEIANRPGSNIDSLRAAMRVARWHDPAMAATLLPMSRISEIERAQVASYILSLRQQR
jgi:mono/diheme cytochrome c family protein